MSVMHKKRLSLLRSYGERRNTNKRSIQISANQPAYIRQVPVAILQQMFEVTATRFHSATKTFVPLIISVVDDTLLQTRPLVKASSVNRQCTL